MTHCRPINSCCTLRYFPEDATVPFTSSVSPSHHVSGRARSNIKRARPKSNMTEELRMRRPVIVYKIKPRCAAVCKRPYSNFQFAITYIRSPQGSLNVQYEEEEGSQRAKAVKALWTHPLICFSLQKTQAAFILKVNFLLKISLLFVAWNVQPVLLLYFPVCCNSNKHH